MTYDVVMGEPEHNFIANGFVSHNSHAAAYAAIAYWEMWLKHYYSTEFMWALMRHEDDVVVLTKYVKEARRLEIEVRPPSVNLSKTTWAIVGPRAITASLSDVKGVGETAAHDIVSHQPYLSLNDFLSRVNRRVVNRRVISSLVLADAMLGLIANKKQFVVNAESVCGAKDPELALRAFAGCPDFSEDEAIIERAKVCPLAMDVHPLKAYAETVSLMGPHVEMTPFDEVYWDGKLGFFYGMLTNYKVSRLGEKSDRSYAHLTIEDEQERELRVKVDADVFEQHRYLIDRGEGCCIAMAAIKWKNESARLCYAVDLEDLRQARRDGKKLEGVARWFETSPVLAHGSPAADISQVLAKKMPKNGGKVQLVAVVVAVKEHEDKKKRKMAFFDLAGYKGSMSAICFASSYETYAEALQPGCVVRIELKRMDAKTFILDTESNCRLEILEKPFP